MDKKQLGKLKQRLLQEKKDLEQELKKIATKDKILKDDYDAKFPNFGDKVDENAAEVAAYDGNLSLEANLEMGLQAVNQALEKIKNGRYGICEKCGKEIQIFRLEAFPAAKLCVKCQLK